MLEQSRFLGPSGWAGGLPPLRGGAGAGSCDADAATEAGAGGKASAAIREETALQQDEEEWEDDEKFFTGRSEGTLEEALRAQEDRRTEEMCRALLSYPPPDEECSLLMKEVARAPGDVVAVKRLALRLLRRAGARTTRQHSDLDVRPLNPLCWENSRNLRIV